MKRDQELLKQKLQKWKEAKQKTAQGSVGQNPVHIPLNRPAICNKTGPKASKGTKGVTEPVKNRVASGIRPIKAQVPHARLNVAKKTEATKVAQLPSQKNEIQNKEVFKRRMLGNIPRHLQSASKRLSTNGRGVKRLSKKFAPSLKGGENSKTKPSLPQGADKKPIQTQQTMKERLEMWRKKKEDQKPEQKQPIKVCESANSTKKPVKSYFASSKKLKTIIQTYVSSDKKEQCHTPSVNKTPSGTRRAKRPLNFSTNDQSAKRARTLSISKSVSRLAETPGRNSRETPKNPSRVLPSLKTPLRTKTPKNVKDDGQGEMRRKLENWLKARGKTPERHRHTPCYHRAETWRDPIDLASPGLNEGQLARQKNVLDHEDISREVKKHVDSCMEQYQQGVPADKVLASLDEMVATIPDGRTVSSYWLCKARLVEDSGDHSQTVEVFDEAMKVGAEPKMDILKALHNFTTRLLQVDKDKESEEDSPQRSQTEKKKSRRSVRIMEASLTMPRKVSSRVQLNVDPENIINSSAVKFSVSCCTPLMKNLSLNDGESPKCYVVTPVRRSTRKSFTDLPTMLQDHDEVVDNLDDLSVQKRQKMLYSDNKSLSGMLDFDCGMDGDSDEEKENQIL